MGGGRGIFRTICLGLVALSVGMMFALLFPLQLIAGFEALIIIALGATICCKKKK